MDDFLFFIFGIDKLIFPLTIGIFLLIVSSKKINKKSRNILGGAVLFVGFSAAIFGKSAYIPSIAQAKSQKTTFINKHNKKAWIYADNQKIYELINIMNQLAKNLSAEECNSLTIGNILKTVSFDTKYPEFIKLDEIKRQILEDYQEKKKFDQPQINSQKLIKEFNTALAKTYGMKITDYENLAKIKHLPEENACESTKRILSALLLMEPLDASLVLKSLIIQN